MSTRLPKEAYSTADWFEIERRSVFEKAWTFVGAVQDFAEAGDFRTVTIGANRLLVVQDKEGQLNAIHNICRHRGAELLDGQTGNCGGALVCPYHRWTYGLDGALRGVPNRGFSNRRCLDMRKGAAGDGIACICPRAVIHGVRRGRADQVVS